MDQTPSHPVWHLPNSIVRERQFDRKDACSATHWWESKCKTNKISTGFLASLRSLLWAFSVGKWFLTHLRSCSFPVLLYQWALLIGGLVENNNAISSREALVILASLTYRTENRATRISMLYFWLQMINYYLWVNIFWYLEHVLSYNIMILKSITLGSFKHAYWRLDSLARIFDLTLLYLSVFSDQWG